MPQRGRAIGQSAVRLLLWLCLAGAARPSIVAAQQAPRDVGVADSVVTPAAGALNLLSVQHALSWIEDRYLPLTLGDGRGPIRIATGILYRAAKLSLFDVPQDHMLLVVGHEVLGHGSRLRELGTGFIHYSFDPPIPYGDGGAVTSFSGEFPDTPLAMLAIETAGIEAQNVLADTIAASALRRGRFHYREAWLYFETRYLAFNYIKGASARSQDGHDVADFSRTFEDACARPACRPIRLKDVKRGGRCTRSWRAVH